VIYAPGYFSKGRTIDTTASLVDILPTLLGVAGVPYVNKTLGRDLLVERPKEKHAAYIDSIYQGLLNHDFFSPARPAWRAEALPVSIRFTPGGCKGPESRESCRDGTTLRSYRETSKYLLFHNRPSNPPCCQSEKGHDTFRNRRSNWSLGAGWGRMMLFWFQIDHLHLPKSWWNSYRGKWYFNSGHNCVKIRIILAKHRKCGVFDSYENIYHRSGRTRNGIGDISLSISISMEEKWPLY